MRTLAAIVLLVFACAVAAARPHTHGLNEERENSTCASCVFRDSPGEITSLPELQLATPFLVARLTTFEALPRAERRLLVAPKQGPPGAVAS